MLVYNIETLCEAHGISVPQLERTLEISNGTIRTWKTRSPRLDTLTKVANHFGVSIDQLVSREPPEQAG